MIPARDRRALHSAFHFTPPMLPVRRILYSVVSFAVTLLSFSSSSAQDLANGTIELTASASYQRDSVRREEVDEGVTFDTGATQNVTWSLPAGTLQGKYVTSEPHQFTTQAEGSVSFDGEIFTATASASIQLNGDARYTTLQRGDNIPVVQAKLRNFGLTDFITLYSSDPSHWGQQVLADVSVDVTAALSSSLENSAQRGSLASASYRAPLAQLTATGLCNAKRQMGS